MSKVIFCVPPIKSDKGQAQATQNRQYQFFKDPTFIYPVIPAIFMTMIYQHPGNEILWLDCIAAMIGEVEFSEAIMTSQPDFIVFEANTMLINRYIDVVNRIKGRLPNIKIILCGEHVTAMPDWVKERAKADFFVQGGKWYYEAFKIITGQEWPKDKTLPQINREVTQWFLYANDNGNFKKLPATYTMAAQDCWYRPKQPCKFCTWVDYHPENAVRDVNEFLDEVEGLINFGFREFFDDSGTFPVGPWLNTFCNEMIERGYNKHIVWGCNMRFGALKKDEFELMAKAGCRFILWGFESANQKTLDELSKGYKVERCSQDLIHARIAGIWNHLTVMMGYPWEELADEYRTFNMVKWLLVNDWAASMQATIYMPYPGTASFKEAKEQGLILTEDWDKWDMTNEVVKLKYPFQEALKLQKKYYDISYDPRFVMNKFSKIKNIEDLKFYWRLSKKVINRFVGVTNV